MIELGHNDLWNPPKETRAIVIPVSGEVDNDATMKLGYALKAKKRWPPIARALGYFILKYGNRTHVLTFQNEKGEIGIHGGKNIRLLYHIITFPTRKFDRYPVDENIVINSARRLHELTNSDELPILKTGNVILPQIHGDKDLSWNHLKKVMNPWLPEDRYIAITGNKGTPT